MTHYTGYAPFLTAYIRGISFLSWQLAIAEYEVFKIIDVTYHNDHLLYSRDLNA